MFSASIYDRAQLARVVRFLQIERTIHFIVDRVGPKSPETIAAMRAAIAGDKPGT